VPRLLVVTAVGAERDAVLASSAGSVGMVGGFEVHRGATNAGLLDVLVSGVGAVAAAVATGCALRQHYDVVLSAGIAGGFDPVGPGRVTVADTVVDADLGAETGAGFSSMAELGWAPVQFDLDRVLATALATRCDATVGTILTVATTTGTRSRADRLRAAHPAAVAEAMEGVGVYRAAQAAGVAYGEIRAISNLVGPRDRDGWRIGEALDALGAAMRAVLASPLPLPYRSAM
jgi:futalosine hydrolase